MLILFHNRQQPILVGVAEVGMVVAVTVAVAVMIRLHKLLELIQIILEMVHSFLRLNYFLHRNQHQLMMAHLLHFMLLEHKTDIQMAKHWIMEL